MCEKEGEERDTTFFIQVIKVFFYCTNARIPINIINSVVRHSECFGQCPTLLWHLSGV